MQNQLPFSIAARSWDSLSESESAFFSFQDDYLPLHPNHASKIGLLTGADAERVFEWATTAIPRGWPDIGLHLQHEERLNIADCWNDQPRRDDVRQWLHERSVPFGTTVYLLYERDQVVETNWQMVVRYWDAFAWSVGYKMVAIDHTLQWACCFHHEEVIIFGQRPPLDSLPPAKSSPKSKPKELS